MFDDTSVTAIREYRQNFKKIFKRFCSNTPLFIYFTLADGKVHIFESDPDTNSSSLLFIYNLDYDVDARENIAQIRKQLRAWYPIIVDTTITYQDYSSEELKELAFKNVDIDVLLEKKKEVASERVLVIEKVNLWKDELIIRDCENQILGLYKSRIPILSLLKKLKATSQEEAFEFLKSKIQFIKQDFEDNGGKAHV